MALKFYEMCKIKREALGLNQTEFAKLVGVTGSTISNFENGNNVTDMVANAIRWAFDQAERNLSANEMGIYKLRVAVESLAAETDDENRLMKLNSVIFAATKWTDEVLKRRRFK